MVDTYEETFFLLMLPQFCLMNELTMVDTYEVSYAFQRVQMQIYKSQPKGKDSKRKRHISISFYVHFAMHHVVMLRWALSKISKLQIFSSVSTFLSLSVSMKVVKHTFNKMKNERTTQRNLVGFQAEKQHSQ